MHREAKSIFVVTDLICLLRKLTSVATIGYHLLGLFLPWLSSDLMNSEIMTVLRNPLYLLVIFVGFLPFKALWVQLDILAEFRNGAGCMGHGC
ncbi:hypothetical protein RchiOBHm_Chr2g0169871 [Rosa chinensis]|uniref:Uncharacterized protein n=1 Tax=Rosa chinensis TaxID=74649 RepID=A0A2P6S4X8_ROSCH|nr:hypothetical protein RchiOBHm_Chr2g0169871 [Rosa chinensis]